MSNQLKNTEKTQYITVFNYFILETALLLHNCHFSFMKAENKAQGLPGKQAGNCFAKAVGCVPGQICGSGGMARFVNNPGSHSVILFKLPEVLPCS